MTIALSRASQHHEFWDARSDQRFFSLTDRLDLSFAKPGMEALPHQLEAVNFLLKYRWAILGDDMGLGKTVSSLLALRAEMRANPDTHAYIYCPSNVKPSWEAEIKALGGFDPNRITIRSNSAAAIPDELPNHRYHLIIDEAHEFKNLEAARTFKMLPFGESDLCISNYMLSGTPVKNGSPTDVFPLLRMARHPLGEDWGFFCGASKRNSLQYLARLYKAIQLDYPVMLRRKKKHILDLPEKIRRLHDYKLDAESQAIYDQIYWELKMEYRRRVREGIISGQGEALSETQRLRRAASWGKALGTANLAKDLKGNGARAVVIFTEFKDSSDRIAKELGGAPIFSGSATKKERALLISDFQAGKIPFLILTLKSGGVGITLTHGTEAILHDRDWTPAMNLQAEDRIYRIGQNVDVGAHWMASCAIDRIIDKRILEKQRIIDLIEEGKISELRSIEDIGDDALKIDARDVLAELFAE